MVRIAEAGRHLPSRRPAPAVPPTNGDAETAVIGSMLLGSVEVFDLVEPGDFYRGAYRTIFEAGIDLHARDVAIDPITMADELERRGHLVDVGGAVGLSDAVRATPAGSTPHQWGEIVRNNRVARDVLATLQRLAGEVPTAPTGEAALDRCIQQLTRYSLGLNERRRQAMAVPASELQKQPFAPPDYVVEGMLTPGVSIFGGAPKMGKTAASRQLAHAIATGTPFLGMATERRPVYVLSLEDPDWLVYQRLGDLLGSDPWPDNMYFGFAMARLDEGGLMQLDRWCTEHPRGVVIVDVLERVRPQPKTQGRWYSEDYAAIAALRPIAERHSATILVLHHVRKAKDADDPINMLSGSTGLSGAVDAIWMIERTRSQPVGTLHVFGRAIPDQALAVSFDGPRGQWTALGDASEYARTKERQDALDALRDRPSSPKSLADELGLDRAGYERLRKLLQRMRDDGEVEAVGGIYFVSGSVPGKDTPL